VDGLRVLKFGGTSLSLPERIRRVAEVVAAQSARGPVVTVVSAMGGVTNALGAAAAAAAAGDPAWRELHEGLVERHVAAVEALDASPGVPAPSLREETGRILEGELRDLLHGVFLVREASPRTLDAIFSVGERLSALLLAAALREQGLPGEAVDAREVLVSDDSFGNARVLVEASGPRIRARFRGITQEGATLPVLTGFIAATPRGETSTLGRGGSDYTAAVVGAALGAEAIEIWTDVDGVMTADPRVVPNAFSLPGLTYAELMELSHFGAKVVYPPTVHPARDAGIPLVIRNTFNPDFPGTIIRERLPEGNGAPIRGIASIHRSALLRVEGDGIAGVPGIAERLFGALARKGISVILISQASSERSICLALEPASLPAARKAIDDEFALEQRVGMVDEVVVEEDCSILAVVGEGMRETPNISGRLFSILGEYGINVRAIAQGSSELNISVVVSQADEPAALRAVHDAFFFPGIRPARLFVAGVGRVGETLLRQLAEEGERLRIERGFHLTLVGLARRQRGVVDPSGIDPAAWREAVEAGEVTLPELVKAALDSPQRPRIFVDLTASEEPTHHYEALLKAGVSVVTANKRGVSGPGELYRRLQGAATRGSGLYIETTVGAGLPVLRTMADLMATGDRVERIEGVLSGTLSYLVGLAMEGGDFSALVREAHGIGFTEPDPRDDLSGTDVARKLVILARTAGLEVEPEEVVVEPLLPGPDWNHLSLEEFWERLPEMDGAMSARIAGARERGKRLRYLAEVRDGRASVGLQEVGPDHASWALHPGDNLIAVHSRHYRSTPLVVQGPGAGPEVTAGGVFADILRAVAETR